MTALLPNYVAHILLIVALCFKSSLTYVPNFSNYPANTVPCLDQSSVTSGCSADSLSAEQSIGCLCRNGGGFLNLSAQCIGKTAPDELQDVYSVAFSNCGNTNYPVTISLDQFLAAAQDGTSSPGTTAAPPGTTPMPPGTTSMPPGTTPTSSSTPLTTLGTARPVSVVSSPNHTTTLLSSPSTTSNGYVAKSPGRGFDISDIIAMALGIPATLGTVIGVFIALRQVDRAKRTESTEKELALEDLED